MNIPTLDQLKRALHIQETIEKLQAEMATIFEKKIPKLAKEARQKVMEFYGVGGKTRKKSKMSKAGRKAIAAAQKKRWAKLKGKKSKPAAAKVKPKAKRKKGKMSAAGRAAIVAAQKKRWAKIKKEKSKAAKPKAKRRAKKPAPVAPIALPPTS